MKAILVIDEMPTECIECPFHRIYADGFLTETHCSLMGKRNKDGVNTRAEWCPLKPIPEKKAPSVQLSARHNDEHMEILGLRCTDYEKGWNACIDAITGETE